MSQLPSLQVLQDILEKLRMLARQLPKLIKNLMIFIKGSSKQMEVIYVESEKKKILKETFSKTLKCVEKAKFYCEAISCLTFKQLFEILLYSCCGLNYYNFAVSSLIVILGYLCYKQLEDDDIMTQSQFSQQLAVFTPRKSLKKQEQQFFSFPENSRSSNNNIFNSKNSKTETKNLNYDRFSTEKQSSHLQIPIMYDGNKMRESNRIDNEQRNSFSKKKQIFNLQNGTDEKFQEFEDYDEIQKARSDPYQNCEEFNPFTKSYRSQGKLYYCYQNEFQDFDYEIFLRANVNFEKLTLEEKKQILRECKIILGRYDYYY